MDISSNSSTVILCPWPGYDMPIQIYTSQRAEADLSRPIGDQAAVEEPA